MSDSGGDDRLLDIFLDPVRRCIRYRPAFGLGRSAGLALAEFQQLYGSDPFYNWLGLDTPVVYAAHKAAGGLTSIYRQIGVGVERLFRAILEQELGLDEQQTAWSYGYDKGQGSSGVHTLDACLRLSDLDGPGARRLDDWMVSVVGILGGPSGSTSELSGAVFEIRQGYKSADSKRQNADLRFGLHAYRSGLLPVFAIFSSQVSEPVLRRYRADGMVVLTGSRSASPQESTFAFVEQVIGYDLAGFFERNSSSIRAEVASIVGNLLTPS